MEIFLELFMEIYLNLAFYFFPEDKLKPWQVFLVRLVCMVIALAFIGLFLAGLLLLTATKTSNPTLGIILTIIGGVLTIGQLIASAILIIKNKR